MDHYDWVRAWTHATTPEEREVIRLAYADWLEEAQQDWLAQLVRSQPTLLPSRLMFRTPTGACSIPPDERYDADLDGLQAHDAPYELVTLEHGPLGLLQGQDVAWETAQATTLYSDGAAVHHQAWQRHALDALPDHDYCHWCGGDNTARDGSSMRDGWDCCHCGGN